MSHGDVQHCHKQSIQTRKNLLHTRVDDLLVFADRLSPRDLLLCRRDIRALALPALMSLLVDPILSLVDTAYVGRGLGALSLAALGESTPCTQATLFSLLLDHDMSCLLLLVQSGWNRLR